MEWLIVVAIIGAVVAYYAYESNRKRELMRGAEHAIAKTGIAPDYKYVSSFDGSYLALSFGSSTLIVGNATYQRSYSFSKIISVEVVKDGATATATNRGSQIAGAALGGAVFGGIGAMVGGLSGSTTSRERIRELSIRVTVDDPAFPVHKLLFFLWEVNKKGVDPSGMVKPLVEECEKAFAQLANALRRAQASLPIPPAIERGSSAADEIRMLWELKEKGAISSSEFERQKELILTRDGGARG